MAQASDNTVDNGTGAAVRADINSRLAALFTNHSGSTDTTMVTKYPYQSWFDTSTSPAVLKYRNSSNSSWISFRDADGRVILPNGTTSSPAVNFTANSDTGIFYNSTYGSLGFVRDSVMHAIYGRTLDGQTDSFVFGVAARQTTTVNPTNGTYAQRDSVKGVVIDDEGPVHIGTSDGSRPLTCNKMGSYGSNDASADKFINFNTNGTFRGGIAWNGSSIAITHSSDYRLKENVVDLTGAIDRIKAARPIRFNFIADEADQTLDGFIAHEIGQVVPEMLYGLGKDAVDSDGNIEAQSINPAGLVPLLTAALKEAITKIEALETRVAALEAG